MLKITNNREAFFQWDVGQSLVVDLEEGERITAVHIGNNDGCKFYVVEPIEGLIAVYDELLQSGKDIVAYEYIETADEGHTIRRYDFTVVNRPKAEDYAYTPTQSYSWEYWAERARLYAESAAEEVANIPAKMDAWWEANKDKYKGEQGPAGRDGVDGKDGVDGRDGVDGAPGTNGRDGRDGKDGKDYVITEADYQAIGDKVEAEYTPELTRVSESLSELEEVTVVKKSSTVTKDITYDLTWNNGYYDIGGVNPNSSYKYSTPIPVQEGDVITNADSNTSFRFFAFLLHLMEKQE